MKLKRSDIENQADDIFDIVDEESDNYNSVLQKVNKVRSEMSSLYEIYENARQGAANTLQLLYLLSKARMMLIFYWIGRLLNSCQFCYIFTMSLTV